MEINEFSKVIEAVTNLVEKKVLKEIKDIVDKNTAKPSSYRSADIKELAKAFSKAQGEYGSVIYNRENPYMKSQYADSHGILKAVRPALTANGLSIYHHTGISEETGITILHTYLLHSSGQWIESRSRVIPPKNDLQTYNSTLEFLKRSATKTLLGITESDDATDDDGEVAMANAREIVAKGPSIKYNPKDQSHQPITKEQLEEMEYELAEYPDIAEEILDKLQLQSLADLPKSKFLVSVKRIREIKRLRNEGR